MAALKGSHILRVLLQEKENAELGFYYMISNNIMYKIGPVLIFQKNSDSVAIIRIIMKCANKL